MVAAGKSRRKRCSWADGDALMALYHDREWVVPQRDGLMLWEMLMLEGCAKIEATIRGAQIYCDMGSRGETFSDYCWSFTAGQAVRNNGRTRIVSSPLSERVSKDLKKRGFKFVGPTIVYAWMQAIGIVDDHSSACFRRKRC